MSTPETTPDAPDLTPVESAVQTAPGRGLVWLVEHGLLVLVVLVTAAFAVPHVVESVREGSLELGTVFYPVLLVAFAVLAWTRRSGR